MRRSYPPALDQWCVAFAKRHRLETGLDRQQCRIAPDPECAVRYVWKVACQCLVIVLDLQRAATARTSVEQRLQLVDLAACQTPQLLRRAQNFLPRVLTDGVYALLRPGE